MQKNIHHEDLDFRVNHKNLYREESFFDLKIASIRRLTPVHPDGSLDESRAPIFSGYTQLMSPNGPIPVHCRIQATTLSEAIDKFPETMSHAVDKIVTDSKQPSSDESISWPEKERL